MTNSMSRWLALACAASSLVACSGSTTRYLVSQALLEATGYRMMVTEFFIMNEKWPENLYQLQANNSESIPLHFTSISLVPKTGELLVVICPERQCQAAEERQWRKLLEPVIGKSLKLVPKEEPGLNLSWTCINVDVEEKHLPPECR